MPGVVRSIDIRLVGSASRREIRSFLTAVALATDMSDDGAPTVAALPGDPATWPATVRDCLRFVRRESPAPTELAEWWADAVEEAGEAGPVEEAEGEDPGAAVERRLAFLASADLLDRSTTPIALGRHGREYLDSHDDGVLYEGLASSLPGLETVLEALAIRPLTDVEVADLLAAERDVPAVDAETARTHRRWLAALGFCEHDGGVTDITPQGRRVVDAAGGPQPPGVTVPDEEAVLDTSALADGEAQVPPDREATSPGSDPADQVESTTDGVAPTSPDDSYVRDLKSLYDHTCVVCGDRRRGADGDGYSCVHHLMPPGDPHGGPERPENALVVCPNHRADLERGVVTIDPQTLEIDHAQDPALTGRRLTAAGDHEPGAEYLAYHDAVIAAVAD